MFLKDCTARGNEGKMGKKKKERKKEQGDDEKRRFPGWESNRGRGEGCICAIECSSRASGDRQVSRKCVLMRGFSTPFRPPIRAERKERASVLKKERERECAKKEIEIPVARAQISPIISQRKSFSSRP